LVIMSYQKISEETEEILKRYLQSKGYRRATQGNRSPYYDADKVTFDEAIRMLLKEVGF